MPKVLSTTGGKWVIFMDKGTTGILFFKEYFEYMDDFSPEQFYEFMGLIRDLRFNGIDTNPEEISDKYVRLAWRSVRPSIKKSAKNAKDHQKKQSKQETQTAVIPTCDIQADDLPTEVQKEPENVVNEPSTMEEYVNMLVSAGKTGIGEWAHVRENFMRYMDTGLTENQKTEVVKEAQRILSNG